MEEFKGKTEARLSMLEEKTAKLEKQSNETVKLSTLMEIQIKNSEKQDLKLDKQFETLTMINDNLSALNSGYEKLDSRVGSLEKKQSDRKEDSGSKKVIEDNYGKIIFALILIIAGILGININLPF